MDRRVCGPSTVAIVTVVAAVGIARADPVSCRKQLVKQLFKFGRVHLKATGKCLDKDNLLRIPGPCPDAATRLKIDGVLGKVETKIATACTADDLAALGHPSTCDFSPAATGIRATCSALPAGTPAEFATCLACWDGAELARQVATLYASHALEVCEGALDDTSPACSPFACADPLPDQRDLGDSAETTCQRMIGKAGIKHLLIRMKVLQKCGLAGGTQATCLADPGVQQKLASFRQKLSDKIRARCGNRAPEAQTPFCCRTGTGNECVEVADRAACLALEYSLQEGKVCDVDLSCASPGGGAKGMTWWETCPTSATCPGTPLASLDELVECVDDQTTAGVDALLCRYLPTDWPCAG